MDKEIYCGSVPVSYFDPFDLFESLRPEFQQILPLDNIHWKAFDGTVRTVNRLPIELIPEGRGEADKSNDEQPFIRFLIVNCIFIDQYRAKVALCETVATKSGICIFIDRRKNDL